jgi:phage gpG-like protein
MGEVIQSYGSAHVSVKTELNFKLATWEKYFDVDKDQKLMREIAGLITDEIDRRFEKGGSPKKWAPKKALTVAFEGGSSAPLIYTSALKESISWIYAGGDLIVYTNKKYARVQNYGARFHTTPKQTMWMWANLFNKKGRMASSGFAIHIPARPFMYFTKDLARRCKERINRRIKASESIGS